MCRQHKNGILSTTKLWKFVDNQKIAYLSGEFVELSWNGHILSEHARVLLTTPIDHLLKCESVVLWDVQMLDVICLDELLGAIGHITQVPDCDRALGRTVGATSLSEKVKHLLLGGELGCERGYWYPDFVVERSAFHLVKSSAFENQK